MAGFGVQMTEDEIRQSADYFSSLKWAPWIKVVESDTVPKTRPSGGMWLRLEGADAGTEPLGRRIIETPKNTEFTEKLRNPRSGFTAYVPKGSIAKGEALRRSRARRRRRATICHGADLGGLAVVPTLRGRSPSYIARQLADLKLGTRHGLWSPLMAPVVANLTADDILNTLGVSRRCPCAERPMRRVRFHRGALIACAATLAPVAALAHHSRAVFDTKQEVAIEGTVTVARLAKPAHLFHRRDQGFRR